MNKPNFPTTEQILAMMETQLGREGVPPVMRRAAEVMPDMLAEPLLAAIDNPRES